MPSLAYGGDCRNKIVALVPLGRQKDPSSRVREQGGYRVNRIRELWCAAASAVLMGSFGLLRRIRGYHTRSDSEATSACTLYVGGEGSAMTNKSGHTAPKPAGTKPNEGSKSSSKPSVLRQPSERLKAVASALNAANNKVDAFKR
jgi:hypothetical protein